jgi:hypothetical protein
MAVLLPTMAWLATAGSAADPEKMAAMKRVYLGGKEPRRP